MFMLFKMSIDFGIEFENGLAIQFAERCSCCSRCPLRAERRFDFEWIRPWPPSAVVAARDVTGESRRGRFQVALHAAGTQRDKLDRQN